MLLFNKQLILTCFLRIRLTVFPCWAFCIWAQKSTDGIFKARKHHVNKMCFFFPAGCRRGTSCSAWLCPHNSRTAPNCLHPKRWIQPPIATALRCPGSFQAKWTWFKYETLQKTNCKANWNLKRQHPEQERPLPMVESHKSTAFTLHWRNVP